jgi:hypothetical protein
MLRLQARDKWIEEHAKHALEDLRAAACNNAFDSKPMWDAVYRLREVHRFLAALPKDAGEPKPCPSGG